MAAKKKGNRVITIPDVADKAMRICWDRGITLFPEPTDRAAQWYYIRHKGLPKKWWPMLTVYSTAPSKATEISLYEMMYELYIDIASKIKKEDSIINKL